MRRVVASVGDPTRALISAYRRFQKAAGTVAALRQRMLKTIEPEELEAVQGGYSQQMFSAMQHAVGMGLTVNSTDTGGHASNSMHYKGRDVDAIGTEKQMSAFYNWAAQNTHPHELIHRTHFLKDGHNGHVHFSI
jgi:hypothetical protein